MGYNPNIHHRQSIRLREYDYQQAGLYFVTLCVCNRACLFGRIENREMVLNDAGRTAQQCWMDIPNHYPNVVLHEYIIMPNHVHGILQIGDVVDDVNVWVKVRAKNFSPLRSPLQLPRRMDNWRYGEHRARLVRYYAVLKLVLPNGCGKIPTFKTYGCGLGEKFFAPTVGPTYAPTDGQLAIRGTSRTIGSVLRGFKIGVTKWMRENTNVQYVWLWFGRKIFRPNGCFEPLTKCCFTRMHNNVQPCPWHCANWGCGGLWGMFGRMYGEIFFAPTNALTIATTFNISFETNRRTNVLSNIS